MTNSARVHAIQISNGGVPKLPVQAAVVSEQGLVGDRQRDRRYHGGPSRAVSLYSLEVIEKLRAEGHAIAPGAAGENVTIHGLAWSELASGVRLAIGGEVVLELTKPAGPCKKIAACFSEGDYSRIAPKLHPADTRWYARVLREGTIRPGDIVVISAAG
jgi:MOSC domain-containing protein YiiM